MTNTFSPRILLQLAIEDADDRRKTCEAHCDFGEGLEKILVFQRGFRSAP